MNCRVFNKSQEDAVKMRTACMHASPAACYTTENRRNPQMAGEGAGKSASEIQDAGGSAGEGAARGAQHSSQHPSQPFSGFPHFSTLQQAARAPSRNAI